MYPNTYFNSNQKTVSKILKIVTDQRLKYNWGKNKTLYPKSNI